MEKGLESLLHYIQHSTDEMEPRVAVYVREVEQVLSDLKKEGARPGRDECFSSHSKE
jgi:hypothetical protein